jgi:hypothetical protein
MGGWGGRTLLFLSCACGVLACGSGSSSNPSGFDAGIDAGVDGPNPLPGDDSSAGWSDVATMGFGDGAVYEGGTHLQGDPVTCDQATASHSYIGCDYWPTVLDNAVWSVFDYAVIVANAGMTTADITVTGPAGVNQTGTVAPGALTTIYLPWVPSLKGMDADNCALAPTITSSVFAAASAYHLVSTVPVTVYQFNALEYKGAGGPASKNWSSCPGDTVCRNPVACFPFKTCMAGCYSFSNDASLLLPSTAMTGNYRVAGYEDGSYVAITAIQDNTTVVFTVSGTGTVLGGTGIAATPAGGKLTLQMNAGDVAELFGEEGTATSDLSGSIVKATCGAASCPVEVFTGSPCEAIPATGGNTCDHLEEVNFPAETLGKDYVVTVPTGPYGSPIGHLVRLYGDFDGTTLTYQPAAPPGCPATLNAGQVVECGIVTNDFEVKGSQPFLVGSFMESGPVVDPTNGEGDPSESFATAVEQYRTKYVFLAPQDYDYNFADVVAPTGATLTLDGAAVTVSGAAVGSSGYDVYRVPLGAGQGGAHVLVSTAPVGMQVLGYGAYTSYQYPGGLDLQQIAAPPQAN